MNEIIIEKSLSNKNISWYYDYFSNYRFFTYLKDSFIQKWIFFNR